MDIPISHLHHLPMYKIFLLALISRLMSILGKCKASNNSIVPYEFMSLDIVSKLRADHDALKEASSDFGNLIQNPPAAVLYPSSINDIIELVKFSHNCSTPFTIAAKGRGHSARGQAMAQNGVVIEMSSLNNNNDNNRIKVSWDPSIGFYADVGGEQLWIDVLKKTVEQGVAPVSWTDYLYLTVGGTLSNAGISGQTFRYGPQIFNVYEMDVITGKGELMTCSHHVNSELFFGVLGGLGQFGIITRARIALREAPTRVKWMRMIYDDFSAFTKDQEHLISMENGMDYVEGSLILHQQGSANNWRSSFFTPLDQSRIASLSSKFGILYSLEVVKYYDDAKVHTIDMEIEVLLEGMKFVAGLKFKREVSYIDFLNRVRSGELELQSKGEWEVPHPWLNLFVPKSSIMDFNAGVFLDIIHRQNKPSGPILVYPTSRKMFDERMSAVIPEGEEEIFYCVGLLHSSSDEDLDSQNNEILEYCNKFGLKIKQYLPHYKTKQEWKDHFGPNWKTFQERKALFDPKMILSPGQMIFTPNSYS
ncbi:oxidase [Lithospermum erythrorhizon]|uniref:cytokinin dehydrogenase n=1 Tax=Lithospermum erythrorhizon TaxID=34254 RepID=A0AAV3R660_LITER